MRHGGRGGGRGGREKRRRGGTWDGGRISEWIGSEEVLSAWSEREERERISFIIIRDRFLVLKWRAMDGLNGEFD